jgi:hypothetical protein
MMSKKVTNRRGKATSLAEKRQAAVEAVAVALQQLL